MAVAGEGDSAVEVDDSRVALTDRAAARLASVTVRQLRYWDETDLLKPAISQHMSLRKTVRLYEFDDLVALLVIARLRDHFSLQQTRKIVAHLQSRGYEQPLTELRFAVADDETEVFFQHPDGTWEGRLRTRSPATCPTRHD